MAVLDARAGAVLATNRETQRIFGELRMQGRSLEQLSEVVTVRRADGRLLSPEEFPLTRALREATAICAQE